MANAGEETGAGPSRAERHAAQMQGLEGGNGYHVEEVGQYATVFAFGGKRRQMIAPTGRLVLTKPDFAFNTSYPPDPTGPDYQFN